MPFENDRFWGKGFTEWRQISRGLPRFPGHYQPRIPSDLGFYDLTSTSVLHQQVEMAKAAGIHGFGFYYYRFDSLRVLEKPLEALLASPDIDMPFMLIWANENWTRTWDGMSGQMLLRQSYDRNDETELLADLARHFTDRRYIRIKDRPLFVIYQPRHVPDGRATFARWRALEKRVRLEPLFSWPRPSVPKTRRHSGLTGHGFPPHKLTSYSGRPVPDAFSPAFTSRVVSMTMLSPRR
jgi:lipopolysaccharide biosynthesis protein